MGIYESTDKLADLEALDSINGPLADAVGKVFPDGPVKDALSGTWLGHSLHPVLTDVAIGSWTSAALLDLIGGRKGASASRTLTGFGILGALPTAITGLVDWADMNDDDKRVGIVHALGNTVALAAFMGAYSAKRRGKRFTGAAIHILGMGAATASAYLGGHLSFGRGLGVNQTAFEELPEGWSPVCDESELEDGKPRKVQVGEVGVMIVKHEGRICALANRCSHLGGPLNEGDLDDGNIVCPWHQSTFSVIDGSVVNGPAESPQPSYETRVQDGRVEIREA